MIRFAIATRDELWLRGRRIESRLSHGEAIEDEHGIIASDARDDALVDACARELERLRDAASSIDARVRLVAEARLDGTSATITIALGGISIVTTPEHAAQDYEMLRAVAKRRADVPSALVAGGTPALPIVWRNGSAALLLHEAIGHAAEHEHEPIAWPSWLDVDVPLAMRRATFRDVPLRRMTHVVARQHDAPFELPPRRIEVLLIAGGAYEPLTHEVLLRVAAADLIDGNETRRLAPFDIRATREEIARSLTGAEGETIRYPGVVCSREGQELVVPSAAPVMITVFR
ncbi:MAG TPA: hypothetical protein VNA69_03370 [Thermoanaerobaculia bacterium]|nr:hypothetical protein [Thermoanaerobaculia bacterium]